MNQEELINKIKTLLPQEKEKYPRELLMELDNNGYNRCLEDTYKALPDIINYIYEDLRKRIEEKRVDITSKGNYYSPDEIVDIFLSLLEIKDK